MAKVKLTAHTEVAVLTSLSEIGRAWLAGNGFATIADFADRDVAAVLRAIRHRGEFRDAKALFESLVRSGVNFAIDPATDIADLGIVHARQAAKLERAGVVRLSDLAGVHYPEIYDLIGYGPGKVLLVAAVTAKVAVQFSQPGWDQQDWKTFLEHLVGIGLVQWEDVAIATLAELNPPQVGTQVANAVKHAYPAGEAMREVWKWLYAQSGKCEVSGKRLFLEADHKTPKEHFVKAGLDIKGADRLDNFQLLTKRENVIKRGSHRLGGISFANASAVLMYILLRYRPKTIRQFETLCRSYGLTMSAIRFQEAWAMAIWLARDGHYELEQANTDLLTELATEQSDDLLASDDAA